MSGPNPQLFEQGNRYDEDGEEIGSRSLWTNVTLRDLFAGFALAGILAKDGPEAVCMTAAEAFSFADAMLLERAKGGAP